MTARWKNPVRRRGFTLTEALLASVILTVTITAIIAPFTAGAQNEQVDARRILAVSYAQEMLEEILAKPFDDPDGESVAGPEVGESERALFDNMDDYHGYSEAEGAIKSFDGEVTTEANPSRFKGEDSSPDVERWIVNGELAPVGSVTEGTGGYFFDDKATYCCQL